MLKLTRIDKTKDTHFTEQKLVTLHFTDCESSLLGATFVASDYVIVGHLDALTDIVKDNDGNIDLETMLANANEKHKGTIEKNAFGFTIPVCDIIPNAKMIIAGGVEIGNRRVMGLGKTEAEARIDAIGREKGRLNFAIAKGKVDVIFDEIETKDDTKATAESAK